MMTIKEFASLCGCNTQTLRYYDKIDLLKPVKVDQWSGYRYYESNQAVDFVKIKNLQAADFAIEEIKRLLVMTDQQVYEAFERKIAEQTEKLERIREIQQSYLTEVTTMKNLINSFCDNLIERAADPELRREFGLGEEDASRLVDAIRSTMLHETVETGGDARQVNLVMDDTLFEGTEAIEKMTFLISEEEMDETVYLNASHIRETAELTENMETVWEFSGWSYTHEVLDRFPSRKEGERYAFVARLHDKGHLENLTYPLFFIGALLLKGYDASTDLHGFVEKSSDGQNHFELMRKL